MDDLFEREKAIEMNFKSKKCVFLRQKSAIKRV